LYHLYENPRTVHAFKNNEHLKQVNRRDNTIIINDYHSNIVGQYAKKKEEQNTLTINLTKIGRPTNKTSYLKERSYKND
jgi:hypothetical protein